MADDLSKKSCAALKALCKERGLKGFSTKKKAELLELLAGPPLSNTVVVSATTSSAPSAAAPVAAAFTFIDLFCGIGGFHQALAALGGKCVLACDIDAKCREVYEANYGLKPEPDVTTLNTTTMPSFDVLCGGFPCQAFSHSGKQLGFADTRGTLFLHVARILKDKQPKYFLLENVKNLKGHDGGRTWTVIYNALKEVGYQTYETPLVISPHMLGVPQHRERVVIVGIRNDLAPPTLPPFPTLPRPVTHISSILETDATRVDAATALTASERDVLNLWETFVQYFKAANIKLPTFPLWSDDWDSTHSISEDPAWKQRFIQQNRAFYAAHATFLGPWLTAARANPAFRGAKRKFEWQCGAFKPADSLWSLLFQFRPSGIRVKRANYSPALVAMAQIVYVGEKGRKLTPREVARLQSFPESFRLPSSPSVAYKQFGNAVNVEVIKWAAKHLFETVGGARTLSHVN